MITWERHEGIGVLRMADGENRLNANLLDAFESTLDEAEGADIQALVTTGTDRFFSTGLDLAWLSGDGRTQAAAFLERLQQIFVRLLTFPVATVAAINGHAFAGGAMLATCHDLRIMRSDRGFFCLPEIDLATGQPLTPGMVALLRMKLPQQTFHEAIVTGRRYGGVSAKESGIVQAAVQSEELIPKAVAAAQEAGGRDKDTLVALKRGLAAEAITQLLGKRPLISRVQTSQIVAMDHAKRATLASLRVALGTLGPESDMLMEAGS